MPVLIPPALPAGTLRAIAQPRIDIDDDLTLRPWRETDAATVRAAFDDPDIQRWHVRRLDDEAEARAWIADWATRWQAETDASWAIADRADRVLGQVGLRVIDLTYASAHVSYWVLPQARGRNAAVRATRAMTEWTFTHLRLHRMALEHSTRNTNSCRVATKAGFPAEGTARASLAHADGWHDMHLHAKLNANF